MPPSRDLRGFLSPIYCQEGYILGISLYFSLLPGKSDLETGSIAPASATTHSEVRRDFPVRDAQRPIGGVVRPCLFSAMASRDVRGGFGAFVSARKIPFPGNRDLGSERRSSNAGLWVVMPSTWAGVLMKIDWTETIGGVPLIKVRDLLRYMGAGTTGGERTLTREDISHRVGCDIADELVGEGLLHVCEKDRHGGPWYEITDAAPRLANVKMLKRINRSKANFYVTELLRRADDINANLELLYREKRILHLAVTSLMPLISATLISLSN
jgi:hypothetical protein